MKSMFFLMLFSLISFSAKAELLVQYNVGGVGTSAAKISTKTTHSSILSDGVFYNGTGTPVCKYSRDYRGCFSVDGWQTGSAPDPNIYYSFTLENKGDQVVSVTNINLSLNFGNIGGLAGPSTWILKSNLDNFTNPCSTIDLSGQTFDLQIVTNFYLNQFIPPNSKVEFRMYGCNAEGPTDYSGIINAKKPSSAGVTGTGINMFVYGSFSPFAPVLVEDYVINNELAFNIYSIIPSADFYLDVFTVSGTTTNFVPGFNYLNTASNYIEVSNLAPNTEYFARAKTHFYWFTSGYSDTISMTTTPEPNCLMALAMGLLLFFRRK